MKLTSSLFLFLFAVTMQAQTTWSVDDCMRYAVKQNLKLKNSHLDSRIAREDYIGAMGDFLPSVSTSGDLGKRIGRSIDPKTNAYTSSSFMESNLGLNVSLPLFEGFTRINRARFTKLNQRISMLDAKTKENDTAYEVLDAFYKVCFEEKMWLLTAEQRKLSEHYLVRMEEFVTLGMRSPSDLQEVKARLETDKYQETVRSNNCRTYLLYLKELLNMKGSDTLQVGFDVDDSTLPVTEMFPPDSVYKSSEELLPQFQAMALRQKAAHRAVAIAAGRFSPTIRAEFRLRSGYYDTEQDTNGHMIPLSEQLRNNQNKYIGLSVSFPLFSGLSRFTEVRKERLRMKQINNDAAQQKLTIYAEIEDACQSLQAATLEHRQALELLKAEQLTLKENEEKWEEGLISVFELMEKRNRYISAKAELSRTRLQYEIKYRTIRFYRTGSFLYNE